MNSLEELKQFAGAYQRVPVAKSIPLGDLTPICVFKKLKYLSNQCFILESLEDKKLWGRYTFLGYNPKMEISCLDGKLSIKTGSDFEINDVNPDEYINRIMEENKAPKISGLPPFTGGLVGYFSYDYIKYSEPSLNLNAEDSEHFKDVDLMLFEKIIAFDLLKEEIVLIENIKTDCFEENYHRARRELNDLADVLQNGESADIQPLSIKSEFRALFGKDEYCAMVERARKYIYEGDIFQVVLSNRLEADIEGSLFDTYAILRKTNPSPYMFYFSSSFIEIAGASPETLVKLQDGILHTFPLAGSRPRGKTEQEDADLEKDLLADPKELSEHNMLVDLGRNDLGKISKFNSVKVEKYKSIERFSHIMHIGSTVRGEILPNKTALDAINAVLPAGTLSGAPKIRACEIINELENNKRGIYGGAIGYMDFSGNMDTCIAIRIAFKKNNKVFVRSGAGIVADSVPEKEFTECENKMKAVLNALKQAADKTSIL